MGQGQALGPFVLRLGPVGLRIRPIRPIAFDELHIGLLDNLPVDARLDVITASVVDMHRSGSAPRWWRTAAAPPQWPAAWETGSEQAETT